MDKDVIEKAKEYAGKKNKSLSKLVEGYLKRLDSRELPLNLKNLHAPITDSLAGMMGHDDGRDYKELLNEARMDWFKRKGFDAEDLKRKEAEPSAGANGQGSPLERTLYG
jgi:hypothetical protein